MIAVWSGDPSRNKLRSKAPACLPAVPILTLFFRQIYNCPLTGHDRADAAKSLLPAPLVKVKLFTVRENQWSRFRAEPQNRGIQVVQQPVEANPLPAEEGRSSDIQDLTPRAAAIVDHLIITIPRFKPEKVQPTGETLIRDLAIDSLAVMEILFSVEEQFGFDLPLTTDLFQPDDNLIDLARRVDIAASDYTGEF
jgi:acyl carrier protein